MEEKKKSRKGWRIAEIVILSLLVVLFVVSVIIEIVLPESGFTKALKENGILDVSNVWPTFKAHIPVIVSCILYIALAYAVCRILRIIFKSKMEKDNRTKTIFTLADGFVKYGGAIIIIILVLKAFGVNTTALIASVGVLTLVVGLGAQPLIADIIAGMFIIFENEYNVGEIVSINNFRGTVIEIGIRSTKLLDAAGNIKIINNNNVGDVVNLSREPSLAVVECDFPYDVPLATIENLLEKNFDKMKADIPDIIEGPYYKGVSAYKDSNVTVKIVATCKEDNRFQVERDMLRAYRNILVEHDIDISYPQVVINYPEDKEYKTTNYAKKKADVFHSEQREESQNMEEQSND